MAGQSLLQELCKRQKLEYAICDVNRRVMDYSPSLIRYVHRISGPLRGQQIEQMFDLLAGMEEDLDLVVKGSLPQLNIEKIYWLSEAKNESYFSVRVYPYQQGLLVLIVDVTEEGLLEQRVTQQRNELDLLSAQLARSRAELDDLLHRFVPSQVADQIISRPQDVQLGGKKRETTALFADMRGFSRMSEFVAPESMLDMLNQHFELLGQVINQHGGVVTNYAGDMMMAIFNAPEEQPDHAVQAVLAGLSIQSILFEIRNNPKSDMPVIFDFGVGINSGLCVAGYLGYQSRLEYTAVGEIINTASRLSGIAKAGQVLIGESTYGLLKGQVKTNCLGEVSLRGKNGNVTVYEAIV